MVEGRIRKFYEEVVLLKQAFVMNPDQTIEQLVAETGQGARLADHGGRLRPPGARRRRREAKADDFAAEVAALSGA